MFIVSIGDGLGNQMFHYAFYYSLCKNYKKSLIFFDNFLYGNVNRHNGIELEKIFSLKLNYCSKYVALSLCDFHPSLKKNHYLLSLIWRLKNFIWGRKDSFINVDDPTIYYDELYSLNEINSYYLRGNWVNPCYFDKYRNDLISIFKFPQITDSDNLLLLNKINKTTSISIHIRAGDYLKSSDWKIPYDYYDKAIDVLLRLLKERDESFNDIVFFVFSDDEIFAQNKLKFLNNKIIVNCNKDVNSYIDMYLMSKCKHNIIANSTFSFWGAYLNQNESKIVVSPRIFNSKLKNSCSCEDWIKI